MVEQILFFYIWVDKESQEAVYEGYLVSAGIGDHIFHVSAFCTRMPIVLLEHKARLISIVMLVQFV